jgi:hypothetical protein
MLNSELFSDLENSKFSLRKSGIFLQKWSKFCLSLGTSYRAEIFHAHDLLG